MSSSYSTYSAVKSCLSAHHYHTSLGHNGFFTTLEDIVHFYNARDVDTWPAPEVVQNRNTNELSDPGLTADEEAANVAFMKTLADGYGHPLNDFAFSPMP